MENNEIFDDLGKNIKKYDKKASQKYAKLLYVMLLILRNSNSGNIGKNT